MPVHPGKTTNKYASGAEVFSAPDAFSMLISGFSDSRQAHLPPVSRTLDDFIPYRRDEKGEIGSVPRRPDDELRMIPGLFLPGKWILI